MLKKDRRRLIALGLWTTLVATGLLALTAHAASVEPLRIIVMDPLSTRLSCDCVAGHGQRDYDKFASALEETLDRRVKLTYAESLRSPLVGDPDTIDLIIGKYSEVVFDAKKAKLTIRPIAALTDPQGEITQRGLFVVRVDDKAMSMADLTGRKLLFGPVASDEKHAAAMATLEAFGLPLPESPAISSGCTTAALAVVENEADAAVISGYAMPLLAGCGAIDPGSLRVVGRTDPIPFITVFATESVDADRARLLQRVLTATTRQPKVLAAMETKRGFVSLRPPRGEWTDWRTTNRAGVTDDVPTHLTKRTLRLWSRTLTGPGMSGLAVADGKIIVADKDPYETRDIWRCLDADTGRQLWEVSYRAVGRMDFTNSPRATPVIHQGLVYLLGAFGDLNCVRLKDGAILWRKNLARDFMAKVPTWGYSSTPLIVDDMLIVNPGSTMASLVALDRRTGQVIWVSPGKAPAYAAFLLAELGGKRQIVGYDAISLGGWDPKTGKRLWQVIPKWSGDYNVPTPIAHDGKLLVATENNGTRLYHFDTSGRILPEPIAVNKYLEPETSSPVLLDGLLFGSSFNLMCLDINDDLKTRWETDDDPFGDYASFIAGNGHVLATTQSGMLVLFRADCEGLDVVGQIDLMPDVPKSDRDVWSHPVLVGDRFYVRGTLGVSCFLLR